MQNLVKKYEKKVYEALETFENNTRAMRQETRIMNAVYTNGVVYGLLEAIEEISLDDFVRIWTDVKPRCENLAWFSEGIYRLKFPTMHQTR